MGKTSFVILLVAGLALVARGVLANLLDTRTRQRAGLRSDEQATATWKGVSVTLKGAGLALIVPGLLLAGFAALHLADAGSHPPSLSEGAMAAPDSTGVRAPSPSQRAGSLRL
jgi:hypothetical protein